jgi:hypothetical protein
MDAVRLNILQAELEAQLAKIDQVYAELEDRTAQMSSEADALIESTGYQIHNLYNAVEDLLKIVAAAFENSIADLSRWHTELLDRMTLDVKSVRPQLISMECAAPLHELRAFRHFFRHAYGVSIDYDRVRKNVEKARQIRPLLRRDIDAFLAALQCG